MTANPAAALTLPLFCVTFEGERRGLRFTSLKAAKDYSERWSHGRAATIEDVTAAPYSAGQPVEVYAFARWRTDTVTKVNKTKVVVEFVRNAAGQKASRSFGGPEIRHA